MKNFIIQPPNPGNLLFAIRSIGYSFSTAVADIIDNSISAKANKIYIYSEVQGHPYFCFLDNGTGMTDAELSNAMLLGSARKNSDAFDLGRFGLGLKSASLSQCRRFSVLTKKAGSISAMAFDIDEIEKWKQWRLFVLSPEQYRKLPQYEKLKDLEHGTLVVWENFDKIEKSSKNFEISFRKLVSAAKSHVEYVFHRFYDSIDIYFNEQRIEKRDPFLKDSYGRQQEGRPLPIQVGDQIVTITPYTLPYSNSLSEEEKQLLGKPRSIYDEQGLYLYRNKRLIAWGSWFYTEVRSELNKLARVQVDIPSALDDIWMLDVKKSSAKIPDIIKEPIRIAVNDSTTRSRGTLRHPGTKEVGTKFNVWERLLSPDNVSVSYRLNRKNPLLNALMSRLDSTEVSLLENFIRQVESFIPKTNIHHDECQDIPIVDPWKCSLNELEEELLDLTRSLSDDFQTQEELLNQFLRSQKYECLSKKSKHLRERLKNEH